MDESVFRVGMSGHLQLGDEATIQFVAEQFVRLLSAYQEQALQDHKKLVVYAALAIGADQLFVKKALELHIPVEAIIPCARYADSFLTDESRAEYTRLLQACQQVHQLPLDECSQYAFLAAGHQVVENSDVVVVAWNGYPAAGKGGTADVVSYARFLGRPWVHVDTSQHKVEHYQAEKPPRAKIQRERVADPESVLVLPLGQAGTVLMVERFALGANAWQLTIPGGEVTDTSTEGLRQQAAIELRKETGYRASRIEKLVDLYGHSTSLLAHKVHLFVANGLEWRPLDIETGTEAPLVTLSLEEALEATKQDYRCDPEAALALWLYARLQASV